MRSEDDSRQNLYCTYFQEHGSVFYTIFYFQNASKNVRKHQVRKWSLLFLIHSFYILILMITVNMPIAVLTFKIIIFYDDSIIKDTNKGLNVQMKDLQLILCRHSSPMKDLQFNMIMWKYHLVIVIVSSINVC